MNERRDRLFLAVALTDDARHGLSARLQERLAGRRLPGRPVPIDNWHITLRFLGSTTPLVQDEVLAHLDQHVQSAPFRIRFAGLGAFPRAAKASVLWIGVAAGDEELTALADECEAAAQAGGLEPEGRRFHPHVTISRLRPSEDVRTVLAGEPLGVAMDVAAVTLYRSILGGGRPARYEPVDVVEL